MLTYTVNFVSYSFQFIENAAEDEHSVDAHVAMLQSQYRKKEQDMAVVSCRMEKTHSDRRAMVYNGISTKAIIDKYPTLKMPDQVLHIDIYLPIYLWNNKL